jgi:hypothetical protein
MGMSALEKVQRAALLAARDAIDEAASLPMDSRRRLALRKIITDAIEAGEKSE